MKIVPMVQPIQAMEIDQAYRHWRIHLMISMYVGYGVFYLTRKASILRCRKCSVS